MHSEARAAALLTSEFMTVRVKCLKCRDDFHWHLQNLPQIVCETGFEWTSWFSYNPVPPEIAVRCPSTVSVKSLGSVKNLKARSRLLRVWLTASVPWLGTVTSRAVCWSVGNPTHRSRALGTMFPN